MDIVNGLIYLHSLGIIHGDLKGVSMIFLHLVFEVTRYHQMNVLVDDRHRARLVDFGLSTLLSQTMTTSKGIEGGTLPFMAPELFDPCMQDVVPLDTTTDIWALGVLFWQVCPDHSQILHGANIGLVQCSGVHM
jgi:serine/threonine protein kinase